MNTKLLILKLDKVIDKIKEVYREKNDDYFFTEKELHSYFYHLCLTDGSFVVNGNNLIHTEYPTPFRCHLEKHQPYIKIKEIEDTGRRRHVDLVLLNPNFIEWIKESEKPYDCIKGLGNIAFSKYLKKFIEIYEQFYKETKESVLLYALEFKYFRRGAAGVKSPGASIEQDVEKLKLLRSFKLKYMEGPLQFSSKAKSLVFIGNKDQKIIRHIADYYNKNKDFIDIITKE